MMDERENMNNNEEEEDTTIILTDEDGKEVEFDFLDSVDYENNTYMVLLPAEENDDNEVVIMQLEEGETEDDDSLVPVTDPDVLDAVYEVFKENNKDFFDFEEDI